MLSSATFDGPTVRLDPRRPIAPTDDLELEGPTGPAIQWGKDDDGPPSEVVLAPDLPDDAPLDDPDPVSYPLLDGASAPLGDDVASVVGVRFVAGGRIQWCDAGEADYAPGERMWSTASAARGWPGSRGADAPGGPRPQPAPGDPPRRASRTCGASAPATPRRAQRAAARQGQGRGAPAAAQGVPRRAVGQLGRGAQAQRLLHQRRAARPARLRPRASAARPGGGSSCASSACATRPRRSAASARAA